MPENKCIYSSITELERLKEAVHKEVADSFHGLPVAPELIELLQESLLSKRVNKLIRNL